MDEWAFETPRTKARYALDELLGRSLNPDEAAREARAQWGLTPDAIAATMATDAMLG